MPSANSQFYKSSRSQQTILQFPVRIVTGKKPFNNKAAYKAKRKIKGGICLKLIFERFLPIGKSVEDLKL